MTTAKPLGVVVGASGEARHAIAVARALGIETLALDGDPRAEGLSAADESAVTDIRDPACLTAALGGRRPDVVIPVPIGRWLISGAALNDRYDLPGVRVEAAERCTDKWLFHRTLAAAGLRDADCRLLRTKADGAASAQMALPVIVKPRYGSGSRAVTRCDTPQALRAALDALPWEEDYLVETAVPGQEYGLDAAVIDGVFYPLLLRKKINTPPPYCQCVGYSSVAADAAFRQTAVEAARRAAQTLGLNNTLLHLDVMETQGQAFLIEMSPRPSGHSLHDVFTPAVTGVDMVAQYLAFALGRPYDFAVKETKTAMIRFFDFADCTVQALPSEARLARYPLLRYDCHLRAGDRLGPVRDGGVTHRGYFIITGADEAELCETADRLLSEFELRSLK